MLTATKPPKCKHCKKRTDSLHERIHPDCVSPWLEANREKFRLRAAAKRKADDRADYKRRKEKAKTITELEQECCDIAQEIARIRDADDGCISCHMGPNYGGQWHGSHFRSRAAAAAVQLHLWNIHKACAQCNLFKGGNIAAYRPRVIEKIGLDRVEWLESQNQIVKHTPAYREYLCRYKRVMGKRRNRMKKARKA